MFYEKVNPTKIIKKIENSEVIEFSKTHNPNVILAWVSIGQVLSIDVEKSKIFSVSQVTQYKI
jgi:hypothetical protein